MPWCYRNTLEAIRRTKEMNFLDKKRSYVGIRPDGREFLKLYGKDMEAQHDRVLERDKGICQLCGKECRESGEVHHIRTRGRGGDDSLDNLQWICPEDHRKQHVHIKSGKNQSV